MPTESPVQATNWTMLPLAGEIDLSSAPALRHQLTQAMVDPPTYIILDMQELSFIDSTGLGVLVGALRRVRADGGDMRIARPRQGIERVFAVTGLDRVFQLFATLDEALDAPPEAAQE